MTWLFLWVFSGLCALYDGGGFGLFLFIVIPIAAFLDVGYLRPEENRQRARRLYGEED